MDHSYIEERNIADLYVMGKLSRSEQAAFEQHFINCTECVELLEEIQVVRRALEIAGPEEITQSRTGVRAWFMSAFAQPAFRRQVALLATILLILIAIPIALFTNEIRVLRQELDYLKSASSSEPVAPQDQTGTERAGSAEEKDRTSTQGVAEQGRQDTGATPQKQPSHTATPGGASGSMRPQANTPIFALSTVRRVGQASTGPLNEVLLDRAMKLFVFSLELEKRQQYPTYRATILTNDGKVIWKIAGLQPNSYGALTMSFDSTSFQANDYLLALEGITEEGKPTLVANYPFRITKKKD